MFAISGLRRFTHGALASRLTHYPATYGPGCLSPGPPGLGAEVENADCLRAEVRKCCANLTSDGN